MTEGERVLTDGGHVEMARALFLEGYNCAQAVFGAFCDVTGLGFDMAVRLASSFGGGMGRMREVCGAVSGLFMVAGAASGYSDVSDKTLKIDHYGRIQRLADEFKKRNHTIICRELLAAQNPDCGPIPSDRTEDYYKTRPCLRYVEDAAELAEQMLGGKKMKIAVTYQNGKIFEHFGHTEEFKLYEIQSDAIVKTEIVPAAGSGHGALAGFLKAKGVDALICGGIGAGAQNALKDAGIRLYGGVCGNADEAAEALVRGNLKYNPDIQCGHHGHGHEDGETAGCGGHGSCSGHGHGGTFLRQT